MPKKYSDIVQTKPLQVSFFEILTPDDQEVNSAQVTKTAGRDYSQSIELHHSMPRFVYGRLDKIRREYNGLLPTLEREFTCRGERFWCKIHPTILTDKKGVQTAYYPGANEDILESILLKLYIDGNPALYDGVPGTVFTIYQLRKELELRGHSRTHQQVLDSLEILKHSSIDIRNLTTNAVLSYQTINTYSYIAEATEEDKSYVVFSELLTQALDQLHFRRINYKQLVSYTNNIARLLHRRISHNFTQANDEIPFTVMLSTLLEDFGLEFTTVAKAIFNFKKAAEEMKKAKVLAKFDPLPIYDSVDPRKIVDYKIQIYVTRDFSFEMSNSNKIQRTVKKLSNGVLEPMDGNSSKKKNKKKSVLPRSGKLFDDDSDDDSEKP